VPLFHNKSSDDVLPTSFCHIHPNSFLEVFLSYKIAICLINKFNYEKSVCILHLKAFSINAIFFKKKQKTDA